MNEEATVYYTKVSEFRGDLGMAVVKAMEAGIGETEILAALEIQRIAVQGALDWNSMMKNLAEIQRRQQEAAAGSQPPQN